MNFVALKMLVADRAKYFGLIFAIAFASFLLANVEQLAGVITYLAEAKQGRVNLFI